METDNLQVKGSTKLLNSLANLGKARICVTKLRLFPLFTFQNNLENAIKIFGRRKTPIPTHWALPSATCKVAHCFLKPTNTASRK